MLSAAAAAHAADRIYWSNYDGDSISYANLDGGGGGDLNTGGATMDGPMGMTLDPAAGRVYWANWGANPAGHGTKISYANLDGSGGGGDLAIPAGAMDGPHGLAIDPGSGRIYWPNFDDDSIGFAKLDGSGSGSLFTGSATVSGPRGVAIDPAARRIYWANHGADDDGTKISYANLDGSGGGDLATGGATVMGPEGVALDPGAGRIYWSNYSAANKISYADLDGSGGGDLATGAATVALPHGIALDPLARRIYWANYQTGVISYANLDGSGGGDLATGGATVQGPVLPVLLKAPSVAGAATIEGPSIVGSTLSCCSPDGWAPDLNASLLFRAPQSFTYRWSRDGEELAGGSASSVTASAAGTYLCQITARNAAGAASQASNPHAVGFTLRGLKRNKRKGTAKLAVEVPGPGTVALSAGKKLRRVSKTPAAEGVVRLAVTPRARTKRRLERTGKAKLTLVVSFTPSGGSATTQRKSIKLRERHRD